MNKSVSFFLILILSALSSVNAQKNVILYIGDGYGVAPKTAARMALGQGQNGKRFSSDPSFQLLAADKLKYNTMVTTHSLNSWITDSAPGATVYACGQAGKVDNETIAFDLASNKPLQTILETAKKNGYAVGLVTTTRVTHATPAAFASHIWNRDLEDYIALQYLTTSQAEYEDLLNKGKSPYDPNRDWTFPSVKEGVNIDVILGGGSRHFLPKTNPGQNNIVKDKNGNAVLDATGKQVLLGSGKRSDEINLIEYAKTKGYVYVNSRDALINIDLSQFTKDNNAKLIGLFRDSHCSYEQDRQLSYPWEPTLSEMTRIAIEVLKRKSDKGFFLMVEGGRIDHLEHANTGGVFPVGGEYIVETDKEAIANDNVYNGSTTRVASIFGSDYMIKEVLAFDYSIEEGRKLLKESNQTLLLSTSDHECGGFAIVGLHDEADLQANGTKVRTYAGQPTKTNGQFNPVPVTIARGDASLGGWFPEYTMVDFQGIKWPQAPANGRRLVVAYGSNPNTNGNGKKAGGTPGNHTPADIWVGSDDNVGGTYASRITGKGLLDNTDLFPIMKDFLGLPTVTNVVTERKQAPVSFELYNNYPNPFNPTTTIRFNLKERSDINLTIYNSIGQRVRALTSGSFEAGTHSFVWDGKNDNGELQASGVYYYNIKAGLQELTKKMIMLK